MPAWLEAVRTRSLFALLVLLIVGGSSCEVIVHAGQHKFRRPSVTCPPGQESCDGVCKDLELDPGNCGKCGNVCPSKQVCNGGTCDTECGGGTTICTENGQSLCVQIEINPKHCGGCNTACAAGEVCSAKKCGSGCSSNTILCDKQCWDAQHDSTHCGDCNTECAEDEVCSLGKCGFDCVGTTKCGNTCVDTDIDPLNCGDCGKTCKPDEVCSLGKCGLSCTGGTQKCGTRCVDIDTNGDNCGGCDKPCAQGRLCSGGSCEVSCASGSVVCGVKCIDPKTDQTFCGASGDCDVKSGRAGTSCSAGGQVCVAGSCTVSCQADLLNCYGKCINPKTERGYCGATGDCLGANAGAVCAGGEICSNGVCAVNCQAGLIQCNGKCIDPTSDLGFCGASGKCSTADGTDGTRCQSGEVCSGGICQVSCVAGQVKCGSPARCITPSSDPDYCGAKDDCSGTNAGAKCGSGESCVASATGTTGTCILSCATGQVKCNGQCIVPSSDPNFCGAKSDCSGTNAGKKCASGEVCSGGNCTVSCVSGQVKCNGQCIVPSSDPNYCGASGDCTGNNAGKKCASGEVCSSGNCQLSCASGQVKCGSACIVPSSDPNYCGAKGDCSASAANAGEKCASGKACLNGTCTVSCPSGQVVCGGACIVPSSDPTYCGATGDCSASANPPRAGKTCASGEACHNGTCTLSCPSDLLTCGSTCIDPQTNPAHCGATTCTPTTNCAACVGGRCITAVCENGETNCGGACINTAGNDNNNCGACGRTCSTQCSGGVCPPPVED